MAENIEHRLEALLSPIEDLIKQQIITEDEAKKVLQQRRTHEYDMQTARENILDHKIYFLRAIEYEISFECLRKERIKKLEEKFGPHGYGMDGGSATAGGSKNVLNFKAITEGSLHIVRRIHGLFNRLTGLYGSLDSVVWYDYIKFCVQGGHTKQLKKVCHQALRHHSRECQLWLTIINREIEEGNMDSARKLFLKALRFLENDLKLWIEYMRFEMVEARRNVEKCGQMYGVVEMEKVVYRKENLELDEEKFSSNELNESESEIDSKIINELTDSNDTSDLPLPLQQKLKDLSSYQQTIWSKVFIVLKHGFQKVGGDLNQKSSTTKINLTHEEKIDIMCLKMEFAEKAFEFCKGMEDETGKMLREVRSVEKEKELARIMKKKDSESAESKSNLNKSSDSLTVLKSKKDKIVSNFLDNELPIRKAEFIDQQLVVKGFCDTYAMKFFSDTVFTMNNLDYLSCQQLMWKCLFNSSNSIKMNSNFFALYFANSDHDLIKSWKQYKANGGQDDDEIEDSDDESDSDSDADVKEEKADKTNYNSKSNAESDSDTTPFAITFKSLHHNITMTRSDQIVHYWLNNIARRVMELESDSDNSESSESNTKSTIFKPNRTLERMSSDSSLSKRNAHVANTLLSFIEKSLKCNSIKGEGLPGFEIDLDIRPPGDTDSSDQDEGGECPDSNEQLKMIVDEYLVGVVSSIGSSEGASKTRNKKIEELRSLLLGSNSSEPQTTTMFMSDSLALQSLSTLSIQQVLEKEEESKISETKRKQARQEAQKNRDGFLSSCKDVIDRKMNPEVKRTEESSESDSDEESESESGSDEDSDAESDSDDKKDGSDIDIDSSEPTSSAPTASEQLLLKISQEQPEHIDFRYKLLKETGSLSNDPESALLDWLETVVGTVFDTKIGTFKDLLKLSESASESGSKLESLNKKDPRGFTFRSLYSILAKGGRKLIQHFEKFEETKDSKFIGEKLTSLFLQVIRLVSMLNIDIKTDSKTVTSDSEDDDQKNAMMNESVCYHVLSFLLQVMIKHVLPTSSDSVNDIAINHFLTLLRETLTTEIKSLSSLASDSNPKSTLKIRNLKDEKAEERSARYYSVLKIMKTEVMIKHFGDEAQTETDKENELNQKSGKRRKKKNLILEKKQSLLTGPVKKKLKK